MVTLDVIALLAGVVYGYINPGKEDKSKILKKGLRYGLIFGVALAVLNLLLGGGLLLAGGTVIGIVIAVVYLTIFFIIGAFVGDLLEGVLKK
jgi:Mg/Co/Ni transporter MgtE